MSDPTRTPEFFDTLAKVLLRSWALGYLMLLVWAGLYLFASEFVYRLQGHLFDLSRHEIDLVFYCGIALTKIILLVFFLFPWLAIRLVLRKTKG